MKRDIELSLEKDAEIYKSKDHGPGSREKLLDMIAKSAYDNDRGYEGCSRSVFAALQTHLHLMPEEAYRECLKACTALSGGVARKGEVCGALTAGIMALSALTASEKMESFEHYQKAMLISGLLFDRFREKFGTTKCVEVQEQLLGRTYDFNKEEDRDAWYKDGGLHYCPLVCGEAARMAAELILRIREEQGE